MTPFIKWAGGKRQLLSLLTSKLPTDYNKYIEPFVGGGALFLKLEPRKAIISDTNEELMITWGIIKEKPEDLIELIKDYKNNKDFFLEIRSLETSKLSKLERATRFIYLNKTCYNGLYRVNKTKGQFNTPFGKYKNPTFLDPNNILEISTFLKKNKVVILNQDYTHTILMASKKDFVYLDPPYYPLSKTSQFTSYTKEGFSEDDQITLFNNFKMLDERGCYCMLSNSNCEFITNLYKDYNIIVAEANRSIAAKSTSRTKEKVELLITNY